MKRLYRSREDKVFTGVCGGLGQYFGADSSVIRLVWFILAFSGVGLFAYFIAAIIIPYPPRGEEYSLYEEQGQNASRSTAGGSLLLGSLLVGLGILLLLKRFVLPYIPAIFNEIFWPLVLIIFGALLLLRRKD